MKISRIRITHHRLPLDPPFHAAWDPRPRTRFDATIVRVETDEGLVGIGSGGSMPGFAGHEDLFVGEDPLDLDRHFRVIESLSFHYGRCWPLEVDGEGWLVLPDRPGLGVELDEERLRATRI